MSTLNDNLCVILIIGLLLALTYMFIEVAKMRKTLHRNQEQLYGIKSISSKTKWLQIFTYLPFVLGVGYYVYVHIDNEKKQRQAKIEAKNKILASFDEKSIWTAPDVENIKAEDNANLIQYGRNLISNTSDYLGPEGFVKKMSNGMNCQNCHLAAGTKPFGNNYSAVAATYPKFRARSGAQETIIKRINDCFQRSLNGEALDSTSREMRAIVAYINWLGEGVPKGKSPKGVGLLKLPFLNRAASPEKGQLVYTVKCVSCHATDGNGLPMPEGNGRRYPPLWGERSYNEAAGLFRISNLAGYVKANMPFGASYDNPQLSDEEAWDVAAFINAQPHPKHKFLAQDFPDISKKPFDHPFAPFKDTFSVAQHQFGPFQAVVDFYKK